MQLLNHQLLQKESVSERTNQHSMRTKRRDNSQDKGTQGIYIEIQIHKKMPSFEGKKLMYV